MPDLSSAAASRCATWHLAPAARHLLGALTAMDVRLVLVRGIPGPDRLAWHPATCRGATIFDALAHLRECAIGPAFGLAHDGPARAHALAAAQAAPDVASAVAVRFGDAERWSGYAPPDATRRFRMGMHGPLTTRFS